MVYYVPLYNLSAIPGYNQRTQTNMCNAFDTDSPYVAPFALIQFRILIFGRPFALRQTLSETLTGNFFPFNLPSMSHRPTMNCALLRRPTPSPSTRSHTVSRTLSANRDLDQTSRATTFDICSVMLSRISPACWRSVFADSDFCSCSVNAQRNPLFAAQTPAYRFHSDSVIDSRHRFLSPS